MLIITVNPVGKEYLTIRQIILGEQNHNSLDCVV